MLERDETRDRSLWAAWQQAETPHPTRDRIAILVVLIGGVLAGAIVAWSLSARLSIPRPGLDVFGLQGSEQATRALSGHQPTAANSANSAVCTPEQPSLDASFGALKQRLTNEMGEPGECAHAGLAAGDIVQQTTTGLAIHRASQGLVIFTNGGEHWALDNDGGLLFWTGSSVDPPRDAQKLADGAIRPSVPPAAAPADAGESAVVTGTDGVGVVLRASPRDNDWTPRGYMDGAQVRVLERAGPDWARIRGTNGQEGWVPARYLSR
jgi:Bacterial SH3 domain